MPQTSVIIFAEDEGKAPLLEWLDDLPAKVQDKCIVRIERLAEHGHELRRPEADYLRDGIYELRVRHRNINYRMLYFFHGRQAVLSHGLTKERDIPHLEIEHTIRRRDLFAGDPGKHTYGE